MTTTTAHGFDTATGQDPGREEHRNEKSRWGPTAFAGITRLVLMARVVPPGCGILSGISVVSK
jgi:hypothetical protein